MASQRAAWRLLLTFIGALAMLTLLLAAACGDDDDDSGDDGSDEPTASASPGDGDGGDDGGDEPSVTPGDGGDDGDGGGDILGEIEDFADQSQDAEGVVTYTFTSDGDAGDWTIYSEGDNSRVDVESGGSTFISITTPAASYTCIEDACYSGEGGIGANPYAGFFTTFASSSAILGYLSAFADVDVESSSEEFAGVDGNCYTVSGSLVDDEGTIKWCWTDSGLLLLAQYDLSSGLFEIRATEYSESVPGGSFDPPYAVTTFPS
jgi:hypothetical protein